jgi:hypothetical protein
MYSLCIVELHITVNNIKILTAAQNSFMENLCHQQQKTSLGLHVKSPIFCPILTKFGISRQIFIKIQNIKFHGNPSSGGSADT